MKHFQFVTWRDFGAVEPPSALSRLIKEIREVVPFPHLPTQPMNPIIVHCSAGVGRSGTLIAVDIAMQRIKANQEIDIFGIVKKMRLQRVIA
jgi:protein tyrosine phosphatase